jgi:hypothetical protein
MKHIYKKKNGTSPITKDIQKDLNLQMKKKRDESMLSFKRENPIFVEFTLFAKGKITTFIPTLENRFIRMHQTPLLTDQTVHFKIKIHKTNITIKTLLCSPFIKIQTPID